MNNNLISIIIPVYNAECYLDKCLESVVNQTYKNLEILLIDDGSTDSSFDICQKWKNIDDRIKVYHKENGGQSSARNFGLSMVHGDYITFVDNDDYLELSMYEELIELAVINNSDITGCATLTEYNDYSVNKFKKLQSGVLEKNFLISNILCQNDYSWGTMWNKIFKSDLIKKHRFPEGKQLEDYVLIIKLFNEANKIYFYNKPMYHWIQRSSSQSKRTFYEGKLTIIESSLNIKKYISDNMDKKLISDADYFLFKNYVLVLWELYESNYTSKKEIKEELFNGAVESFKLYMFNSKKKFSDIKSVFKLCITILMIR